MITARIHNKGSETIIAACDSDLMGRTLENDDVRIQLDSAFFGGHEVTAEEFCSMLAQATSGNLVGEETIKAAIDAECIHPDAVATIAGVPYAMFFCMG